MGNMSYCRMQNTANDLKDCIENWDASYDRYGNAHELSSDEKAAQERIMQMAIQLVENYGYEYNVEVRVLE